MHNYQTFLERKEFLGENYNDLVLFNEPKDLVKITSRAIEEISKALGFQREGNICLNENFVVTSGLFGFDFSKFSDYQFGNYKLNCDLALRTFCTVEIDSKYYYIPLVIMKSNNKKVESYEEFWHLFTSPKEDYFGLGKSSYKTLMESVLLTPKSDYDLYDFEDLKKYSEMNQEKYKKEFKEKYSLQE